ncbi:hypothetical protein [Bradyrhizobium sp. S3.5.5]|uniref:hypothetical protein n=1 Tax=Bradyrhizobium sp. S3.5.5 TaxID=3156430 RepID=UPI003398133A
MTTRKTNGSGTDRNFDPTLPSMSKAGFRGPKAYGLESFGWFGGANKGVTVRYRISDQRTLHRPRRTP